MFSRLVWWSETHLRVLSFSHACAELLASAFESLWEVVEFLEDKEKSNKISFYSGNEDRMRNYRSVSFNFIL